MSEKIIRAKETMTARERVKRTFDFEKTDRVTIGYEANGAIHERLCRALGVNPNDMESLYRALGVDYRGIGAPYTGPELYKAPENRRVNPLEGCIMRWVEHGSGGYWDFCDFPLKDADDEAFDAFPVPDADHFDYEAARARALSYGGEYALYVGSPGIPDIINSNGRIMGMEDVLCHLLTENEEFISGAGELYGKRGQMQAAELLEQAAALFAGGSLSEDDELAFVNEIQQLYLDSKKRAKKFTPMKYRKNGDGDR